jgi:hypothetical protein
MGSMPMQNKEKIFYTIINQLFDSYLTVMRLLRV